MRKTLVVIATATVLGFSVNGWGWCDSRNDYFQQDQADQLRRIADAQEDMAFTAMMSKPQTIRVPVIINEAGSGCHWAAWCHKDGSPIWYSADDGKRHRVYVKVCEDDPEN